MSLELLRRTATIAEYTERDTAFHQAIANATHNALLIESQASFVELANVPTGVS